MPDKGAIEHVNQPWPSTASGRTVQRHLPPLAAFRDVEQDHTAGAIDSFPGEIEYLTAAQSGEEREFQLDTGTARRRSDLHKLTLRPDYA